MGENGLEKVVQGKGTDTGYLWNLGPVGTLIGELVNYPLDLHKTLKHLGSSWLGT